MGTAEREEDADLVAEDAMRDCLSAVASRSAAAMRLVRCGDGRLEGIRRGGGTREGEAFRRVGSNAAGEGSAVVRTARVGAFREGGTRIPFDRWRREVGGLVGVRPEVDRPLGRRTDMGLTGRRVGAGLTGEGERMTFRVLIGGRARDFAGAVCSLWPVT